MKLAEYEQYMGERERAIVAEIRAASGGPSEVRAVACALTDGAGPLVDAWLEHQGLRAGEDVVVIELRDGDAQVRARADRIYELLARAPVPEGWSPEERLRQRVIATLARMQIEDR